VIPRWKKSAGVSCNDVGCGEGGGNAPEFLKFRLNCGGDGVEYDALPAQVASALSHNHQH
jgi:hypothetical protein